MMTLRELTNVGRMLSLLLLMFSICFRSPAGGKLLRVYVQGQLTDIQRNNWEGITLKFDQCHRTLQRFLESIKWGKQ